MKEKLASRLVYLTLDLHEKVLLWLTFSGLKPVSEITIQRRSRSVALSKTQKSHLTQNNINKIDKWIADAGLVKVIDDNNINCWYVGRDLSQVKLSQSILKKFDYDNEVLSGKLFGFPSDSAIAYAHNRQCSSDSQRISMVPLGPDKYLNSFLKDKYYAPYLIYSVPEALVEKESQVAKQWADVIRKDIPLLAKWFEARRK